MLGVIANCIGHNSECEHAEVEARTQDEDARWRNVTTRRQTYRGLISAMTTSSSRFLELLVRVSRMVFPVPICSISSVRSESCLTCLPSIAVMTSPRLP
jgi:hypothetical protein